MAPADVAEVAGLAGLPAAGTIEVRCFDLDRPGAYESDRLVLDRDERQRAARFHFDVDRRRFVSGRSQLRASLAAYLGTDPAEVRFSYGEHGRPALHPSHPQASQFVFNLAHSEGLGILAAAAGQARLGVDLEILPPGPPPKEVAEHFFAPAEVRRLRAITADREALAFYQCWTRKEAYLKALGGGLSIPLDGFDMAFGEGVEPRLLVTRVGGSPAAAWSVHDVSAWFSGAVAAVVIEGTDHRLLRPS